MKLKKIHITGFKSFADPVVIDMKHQMIGIVGPNGCGKSNIVDAIRWVMGETSRHIRATTLEDVIFSGSSSRKPLGQASVDLIFDNEDGNFGGRYASYAELAIKRTATREQESRYFINNKRCRRRDIADIFSGTGLGANSYAMIEQGMISRVVQAKPEEMRAYIEEAAGVSHYKERRRDTSNRIARTRDNLERVLDIREEVEKQLRKLKRQVKNAEKFKELRHEKDKVEAELLLLKLRDYDEKRTHCEKGLSEHRVILEQHQAKLREIEAGIEKKRVTLDEAQEGMHEIKESGYQLDAEIGSLGQDISNRHEHIKQFTDEQVELKSALEKGQKEWSNEKDKCYELEQNKKNLTAEIEKLTPMVARFQKEVSTIEIELDELHTMRDQQHSEAKEFNAKVEAETVRTQLYGVALEELDKGEQEINLRIHNVNFQQLESDKTKAEHRLQECRQTLQQGQQLAKQAVEIIHTFNQRIDELSENINAGQSQILELQAQISSLEVLQEASLGHDSQDFNNWMHSKGLSRDALISEKIKVSDGWEDAVETVLGGFIEGVKVDVLADYIDSLKQFNKSKLTLLESDAIDDISPATLASKVPAGLGLQGILKHVWLAENIAEAMAKREALDVGETIVTKDGAWVGKHWIRLCKVQSSKDSVLERKHRIESLHHQLQQLKQSCEDIKSIFKQTQNDLNEQSILSEKQQAENNVLLKEVALLESDIEHYQKQQEQQQNLINELKTALAETRQKRTKLVDEHQRAQQQKQEAQAAVFASDTRNSDIENRRVVKGTALSEFKSNMKETQHALHEAELGAQSAHISYTASIRYIEQLENRSQETEQRMGTIEDRLDELMTPLQTNEAKKTNLLEQRTSKDTKLKQVNNTINDLQKELHTLKEQHTEIAEKIESLRESSEQLRAESQVNIARCNDINDAFAKFNMDMTTVQSGLDETMTSGRHEEILQQMEEKINHLGAINLVAFDEFNELSERKDFLDSQYQDLNSALETLESAIKKIDSTTKEKFKATFEQINVNLSNIFPRLFGGGESYLEMTERDLLNTGITIMAKPPGKRMSSINLMSGGETALTAAAVVFSIFSLKLSPFCVLDEVDAPLDENNIERFCDMIKEMSTATQFIMITHNKLSMEYMNCLIGVTMHEVGVSRLVSVDMEEAENLISV